MRLFAALLAALFGCTVYASSPSHVPCEYVTDYRQGWTYCDEDYVWVNGYYYHGVWVDGHYVRRPGHPRVRDHW